jgi:hypothetical protein
MWLGPAFVATWCVLLSFTARKWWPLPYVFALFWGMCTGLMIWTWSEMGRNAWWLTGLVYAVVLPFWKIISQRNRELYGE